MSYRGESNFAPRVCLYSVGAELWMAQSLIKANVCTANTSEREFAEQPATAEPSVCHSTAASQQSDAGRMDRRCTEFNLWMRNLAFCCRRRGSRNLGKTLCGSAPLARSKGSSLALHGILIFRSDWRVGQSVGFRGPLERLLSLVTVIQHVFHSGFKLYFNFGATPMCNLASKHNT